MTELLLCRDHVAALVGDGMRMLAVGALLVLLASCSRPSDPELLARIGSREIRMAEFEERWQSAQDRGRRVSPEELLDELVARETWIVRAIELGLDRDPAVRHAYENLLLGALRQVRLEPRLSTVTVSDAEIGHYYQTHLLEYTTPAARRLAVIRRQAHPFMSEKKRDQVRRELTEARRLALQQSPEQSDFGRLAIGYSHDQATRYRGGDMGWLERRQTGRWDSEVIEAGYALGQPGEISPLIETDDGFSLVRLAATRPARTAPLEQVALGIRQRLLAAKRADVQRAFETEMRSGVDWEIHYEPLAAAAFRRPSFAGAARAQPPPLP